MGTGCVEMLFGCNHISSPLCPLQCCVFLQLLNYTEISPEESPFSLFYQQRRKIPGCLVQPISSHVLGHPAPCWARGLPLSLLGSVPWWFRYGESGVAMAAERGTRALGKSSQGIFCFWRKHSSVASCFVHQNNP